jgi:hypothetical protein
MRIAWQFLSVVTLFAGTPCIAADVKVIANPSVKISKISSEDLKSVFLVMKTSLADGSHVEPVLLKSGSVHDTFVREYIGKTAAGLENYYRSLLFAGKGTMPKMLRSDAEMLEYVRKTRGAIGYVSSGENTEGVKLLEVSSASATKGQAQRSQADARR